MSEGLVLTGYGKSHASFGELLQGKLSNGTDFLITLPVDLWSICSITAVRRDGPIVITCTMPKSRTVAEMLLARLGIRDGYEITISFSRNIPVGKGLSSSTADMLSTARALQEIFGFLLRARTISEIFAFVEPHDGLMYKSCVVYNHRRGELVRDLVYVPAYWVVAVDFGGVVDTLSYNQDLRFDETMMREYDRLLADMLRAFDQRDDARIALCASASTKLHLEWQQDATRLAVWRQADRFGPLGVVNTHSGTCLGLLYQRTMEHHDVIRIADELERCFGYPVFVTSTLKLLA